MKNIPIIVKAYWPTLRKYWLSWLITTLAISTGVALHIFEPHYLRGIVDTFTSDAPDVELAKTLFLKLLFIVIVIQISHRIFDLGLTIHESRAMRDIDNRSFQKLQQQSMQFFESSHAGSLQAMARRFCSSYESIMDLFFFQFGQNLVMLFVIFTAFIMSLPALTIPFTCWSLLFITFCIVTTKWKYPYDVAVADSDSDIGAALGDSLFNHLAVKTYGQEHTEQSRFESVVQSCYQARLQSWMRSNLIYMGQWSLIAIGELAFIWFMIAGWETGRFDAGDFVFAQFIIIWAVSHLAGFGQNLRRLFSAFANAEEMAEVYHKTPEVVDAPGAHPLCIEDGEVEFHAVRFCYGDPSLTIQHAVQNFTYKLSSRQSLGLVGRSGSGKSTLIKLLLRFYDLDSGYIRIDRQDVANVTQMSLRQQLAVVPQQPILFHRPIRDNVAFAAPDSTDNEIIQSLKQAHAWEFVQDLPEGLDTLVGERGVKLSGGQQQRIAIARAILADPSILILDEATSNLDSETEQLIQLAISNLLKNRTAIVIAHRLSTIMQLDEIVVLSDGQIVENGRHDELLQRNGVYQNLWRHQSGGYIN